MLALPFGHIYLFLKGIKCIITLCIRVCIGKLVGFWLISRTNLYGIDDEIWIFSNVSNSFKKKIKEKMNEKYGMCTLYFAHSICMNFKNNIWKRAKSSNFDVIQEHKEIKAEVTCYVHWIMVANLRNPCLFPYFQFNEHKIFQRQQTDYCARL